jgi:SlyX protein
MANESVRHLEEKIAFLEHHVTQQDKVMLEFAEDLARLRRELALLRDRLSPAGGAGGDDDAAADERPPHY